MLLLIVVNTATVGYEFTGVVATAVFDLMGNEDNLQKWVETKGQRPFDSKTGANTVVYDALVVATVVPAQHRYKSFKAQSYTGPHKCTVHKLPDWLATVDMCMGCLPSMSCITRTHTHTAVACNRRISMFVSHCVDAHNSAG